jgi:hypothetical protein
LSESGCALVGEVAVTEGSKRLAVDKGQDVILACFEAIATSPFDPPSHGNVFPPLDYAGLDARRIIQAAAMQSAVAERWGSFSKIFSTQSEDLGKLNPHQLARANGLECVRQPYEPENSKIVAFACASVPLHSCLNEKEGKIAPAAGTAPVLERFIWEDGEGGFESRTLTLFEAANDQGPSLRFEDRARVPATVRVHLCSCRFIECQLRHYPWVCRVSRPDCAK